VPNPTMRNSRRLATGGERVEYVDLEITTVLRWSLASHAEYSPENQGMGGLDAGFRCLSLREQGRQKEVAEQFFPLPAEAGLFPQRNSPADGPHLPTTPTGQPVCQSPSRPNAPDSLGCEKCHQTLWPSTRIEPQAAGRDSHVQDAAAKVEGSTVGNHDPSEFWTWSGAAGNWYFFDQETGCVIWAPLDFD
jgi:hypothetical protein